MSWLSLCTKFEAVKAEISVWGTIIYSRPILQGLLLSVTVLVSTLPTNALGKKNPQCEKEMIQITQTVSGVKKTFCIDRYENSVEEKAGKQWKTHSPFDSVAGKTIRAVTKKNVIPQAYISANEAAQACAASGKRLCSETEWRAACVGPKGSLYPYGPTYQAGVCNDSGLSGFAKVFKPTSEEADIYTFESLNDRRINQVKGTVAKTGRYSGCQNKQGVHDMVGNLAEWVDDPAGTFLGGFYLSHSGQGSSAKRGEGCNDGVIGHASTYHDYSTGFRCCALPK